MKGFAQLGRSILSCSLCPRLRLHCAEVGEAKRAAFASQTYHASPVPGFGDPNAWLWIIGLAPGAHGANRTGRVFTGDRSGDFLFAALHRAGLANQPSSVSMEDGLKLAGCYISAAVRCAPPDNKPTRQEIANCSAYLDHEWRLLRKKRVILALGAIAWNAALGLMARHGLKVVRPTPAFAHGRRVSMGHLTLIASYHVSQQNTFTGRLTVAMFDEILSSCQYNARNDVT